MTCNRCKGERIIWGKDMFDRSVAINCPVCNKDGVAVRKETEQNTLVSIYEVSHLTK
ncbi:hypothetical protein ACK4CJ_12945 [Enterococcus gallinarum]|uniref:hypothetical protein n=1 Tax=Enterococcus gallinarum TaxID=1353 RepID=UPI0039189C8B